MKAHNYIDNFGNQLFELFSKTIDTQTVKVWGESSSNRKLRLHCYVGSEEGAVNFKKFLDWDFWCDENHDMTWEYIMESQTGKIGLRGLIAIKNQISDIVKWAGLVGYNGVVIEPSDAKRLSAYRWLMRLGFTVSGDCFVVDF